MFTLFSFLPSSRLTGKRTALMLGQPSKLTSSHRWLCVHDKIVISVRGYLAAKRQVKTILTLWRLLQSIGWWLHDKSGKRVSEALSLNPVSNSHSAKRKTAAFTFQILPSFSLFTNLIDTYIFYNWTNALHEERRRQSRIDLLWCGQKKKTEVRVLCNNECINIKRYKNMTTKTLRDLKSSKSM